MSHAARFAVFALVVAPGVVLAADKVAAVVNGEPLTVAELDAAVAQVPTDRPRFRPPRNDSSAWRPSTS